MPECDDSLLHCALKSNAAYICRTPLVAKIAIGNATVIVQDVSIHVCIYILCIYIYILWAISCICVPIKDISRGSLVCIEMVIYLYFSLSSDAETMKSGVIKAQKRYKNKHIKTFSEGLIISIRRGRVTHIWVSKYGNISLTDFMYTKYLN